MARQPGGKAIGLSFLMRFRVLITGAGTTTAVSALKGLRAAGDAGIHIVMGDTNPECAGAHLGDDFALMPSAKAPDFVERVMVLCRDLRIDLVIPIIDYEFMGWAQAAGRLVESGTGAAVIPVPTIRTCGAKDGTFGHFGSPYVPIFSFGTVLSNGSHGAFTNGFIDSRANGSSEFHPDHA